MEFERAKSCEFVKVSASEFGDVLVDAHDDGSGFTTVHLTPEQTAYLQSKRKQRADIDAAAKHTQHLADCKAERERIKAVQQKRWDAEAAAQKVTSGNA